MVVDTVAMPGRDRIGWYWKVRNACSTDPAQGEDVACGVDQRQQEPRRPCVRIGGWVGSGPMALSASPLSTRYQKQKFHHSESPASERARREGLSLMRVPACTPKRGHSPGNATAVLKVLVTSARESKNCGLPSEDSKDSRLETLFTRRWTRPHTVETKAQSQVAPTRAPDRGRAHRQGYRCQEPAVSRFWRGRGACRVTLCSI